MRSEDFEWVAQAIAINAETGGNLAEVLDQVGKTIRERNQIRRQVQRAERRGPPVGHHPRLRYRSACSSFLAFVQPDTSACSSRSIIGIIALVVAGMLLIIGIFWIVVRR